MARMRTVKPEFFRSAKLARVSRDARLLYIGIWTESDDHGRLLASAKHIAGAIFPLDDDATPKTVERWLQELVARERIHLYEVDDARYLHVVRWKHQKVDHPQLPRYPEPTCCASHSRASRDNGATDSRSVRGQGSGVREQGSGFKDQDASRDDVATDANEARSQAPEKPNGNGGMPSDVRAEFEAQKRRLAAAKAMPDA